MISVDKLFSLLTASVQSLFSESLFKMNNYYVYPGTHILIESLHM